MYSPTFALPRPVEKPKKNGIEKPLKPIPEIKIKPKTDTVFISRKTIP